MKKATILGLVCAGALLLVPSQVKADQWNEQTTFTFSQPVEIPGQVLSAGTYTFQLLNSLSDRDIVQVFNKNGTHLYGTFLAIPDYHLRPSGKTIITFEERAAGAPPAVKAWFYPGDNYGHEFVYGKPKALALAEANNQPVASMPAAMAANTTKPAKTGNEASVQELKTTPLRAEQPSKQEVQITEVFPEPPGGHHHRRAPEETAQNTPPPEPANSAANAAPLPHTASSLPLIGLIGLASLSAAGALRLRIARSK
ncbi:MAG TPA: hypothetical protein VMG40_12335 [Bryobacteraceae bacterium]|nr:hypothetical protein [Bryobacteraceae bacterium]